MKALAAVTAAAALTGGAAHAGGGSLIVFSADRTPAVTGDVFRVDANGHVANLTHSPWQETQPVVSPNGKLIAYLSDHGPGGVWLIGVDGRGAHLLSSKGFPTQYYVPLAWSPDSREVAYVTGGLVSNRMTLWVTGVGAITQAQVLNTPQWSPDGRLLTIARNGYVDAFAPDGKRAWTVANGSGPTGWSARGLFATGSRDGRVHVFDERGLARFSVPASSAVWSPDGSELATVKGLRGSVYSNTGRLVSSRRITDPYDTGPTWTSTTHVVFGPTPAFGPNTIRTGSTFAVRLGTRVYTHVIGCDDDGGPQAAITSLQRVPKSSSVVYESDCAEPFDNLYALNGDGTGLRRITNVQANQVTPSISPDRTRIAFGQSQYTGLSCKGCAESLHTIGVDGSGATTLTSPPDCTFDGFASWSPDGTQIMYSHSGCDTAPDAMLVAAAGGPPTDLHVPAWTLAWGPSRIAYADGSTAPSSMWTAAPNGTGRVRAASVGAGLPTPAWSSDGRLAYVVGTTAFVNGNKAAALPFASVRSIAWSPDGTRFLVAAKAKGTPTFDLYTVKTDGTDPVRLTSNMDVSSADWR